jgi:hypothetical protein
MDQLPYEQAFVRIRAAFHGPYVRLSTAQVATLCATDRDTCETVLNDLSRAGILSLCLDGTYARTAGRMGVGAPRARPQLTASSRVGLDISMERNR